ncbi:MAG: gamma-glutamyl-gamma-aminobutyrate hydrolase family protein [Muribaculaceae bacterium]|nr:gamma-glutamyl-gamma-aminobutyrate hydrolase family protein [Muribaculaceae bacterium]
MMVVILVATGMAAGGQNVVRVGLAWQPNPKAYDRVARSIELAGAEAVILKQVRPAGFEYVDNSLQSKYLDSNGVLLQQYADMIKRDTYHGSNAEAALQGIDAVVFLGGEDISPTLFREPQPWHGIAGDVCNATRDVSEYLTMAYCLDHNIPVLGLCRGMQMLAVVSGAAMIQDLGTCFSSQGVDYNNLHRSVRDASGNRHYTPHDVKVTDRLSLLYGIAKTDEIKNVPSWHHQVVGSVAGTELKVTGVTPTQGMDIIEAIERKDKAFALGVQFHPEEAVRKSLAGDPEAANFMQLYEGVNYFRALVHAVP